MDSRSFVNSLELGFWFCFTLWNCSCGICSLLDNCNPFILSLNWILRHLDCFVSSPLGLWNLPLHLHAIVTNLDELQLGKFCCFLFHLCVFTRGRLITATVSSKIDNDTRTSTICSSIHSGDSSAYVLPSSLVLSISHNV